VRLLPSLFASVLLLSTTAHADAGDDAPRRSRLYTSVAALGVSGFGTMVARRLPSIDYGRDADSMRQAFFGGGAEAAVGVTLRPDLAVAVDVAVVGAEAAERSYDTSPNLSVTDLVVERALILADWRVLRHLDLRAGAGFEHVSFVQLESSASDDLAVRCSPSPCPPTDERGVAAANGPAFVLGASVLVGQPGTVNLSVGVDLGLAYLASDVETFLPLTATLRAGVTAF
jgi:hypothetical protein